MNRSSKKLKEVARGAIVAAVIAYCAYLGVIFSFHDLYLHCKLRVSNARLLAKEVEYDFDSKAQELLLDAQAKNGHLLFVERGKGIASLGQARQHGFKAYLKAYLAFRHSYFLAKRQYNRDMLNARKLAAGIRKKGQIKARGFVREVREDANIFTLLLRGMSSDHSVTGYLYDPSIGEITPRLDYLRKIDGEDLVQE